MMKKLGTLVVMLVSLLSGCASNPTQWDHYAEQAKYNQMLEVEHKFFDRVYSKVNINASEQQKVFIADLDLQHTVVDFDRSARSSLREDWSLTQKDISGLQSKYREALTSSFNKHEGFTLVSDHEQADLIIAAEIVELAPNAPKDDYRSREYGVKYFSEGSGEITIVIDIYNQDEQIMKVVDTRDAGRQWEENTRHNNRHNTAMLFRSWARHLTKLV